MLGRNDEQCECDLLQCDCWILLGGIKRPRLHVPEWGRGSLSFWGHWIHGCTHDDDFQRTYDGERRHVWRVRQRVLVHEQHAVHLVPDQHDRGDEWGFVCGGNCVWSNWPVTVLRLDCASQQLWACGLGQQLAAVLWDTVAAVLAAAIVISV